MLPWRKPGLTCQEAPRRPAETDRMCRLQRPRSLFSGWISAAPSQEQSGVQAQSRSAAAQGTRLGVAEELKTYKELLDEGVITQEEFDTKKQQLLNL